MYILQESIPGMLRDMADFFYGLFEAFSLYIFIGIGIIVAYLVVTRVILRGTVYKAARREALCSLTMSGRERSMEYLERFGGLTGVEAQVIRFLRERREVPKRHLEQTFGANIVRKLIDEGMIEVR